MAEKKPEKKPTGKKTLKGTKKLGDTKLMFSAKL